MAVAAGNTTEESQIRVLIDDRVKASRAKDAVALVANHAPEVVTFDVVNPLQNIGADAAEQRSVVRVIPGAYRIRDPGVVHYPRRRSCILPLPADLCVRPVLIHFQQNARLQNALCLGLAP